MGVMKARAALIVALFAALMFAASGAKAQTVPGFYFGAKGGLTFLQNMPVRCPTGTDPSLKTQTGYGLGGSIGYAFRNGLRVELEVPYRHNDASSISGPGFNLPASGSVTSLAVMGNLLYDLHFLQLGALMPHIGGGIGYAHLSMNNINVEGLTIINSSSDVFAYQCIAGISYAVTSNFSFDLDYNYFATADPTFKTVSGQSFNSRYRTNNVMLGFTYHFGS
jgi:OmpA-OmpF porin, OOP family